MKIETIIPQLPLRLILLLARVSAWVRPLKHYPGWYFGIDKNNPNFWFRLRKSIWEYCNERQSQQPIIIKWYYGLRVLVYLGNDTSSLLFIGGCIDPNEFFLLDKVLTPGMTFVDIGANEGHYTLFASKRLGSKGRVLSIEPSKREFSRLSRNLQINNATNVRLFRLAISNYNGQTGMTIAGYGHEGQNTFGTFVHKDIEFLRTEQVKLKRLDDLIDEECLDRLDVMKIDVEGAEFAVLDGAQNTLSHYRPIILLEILESALQQQGSNSDAIFYSNGVFTR